MVVGQEISSNFAWKSIKNKVKNSFWELGTLKEDLFFLETEAIVFLLDQFIKQLSK